MVDLSRTDRTDGCPEFTLLYFMSNTWNFHRLIQQMDSLHFHFEYNIWWIFHGLIQGMDALVFSFDVQYMNLPQTDITNGFLTFSFRIKYMVDLSRTNRTDGCPEFYFYVQYMDLPQTDTMNGFLKFSFMYNIW